MCGSPEGGPPGSRCAGDLADFHFTCFRVLFAVGLGSIFSIFSVFLHVLGAHGGAMFEQFLTKMQLYAKRWNVRFGTL